MVAPGDLDIHCCYVNLERAVARLWTCTTVVALIIEFLNLGAGHSSAIAAKLRRTAISHVPGGQARPQGLSSTKLVI